MNLKLALSPSSPKRNPQFTLKIMRSDKLKSKVSFKIHRIIHEMLQKIRFRLNCHYTFKELNNFLANNLEIRFLLFAPMARKKVYRMLRNIINDLMLQHCKIILNSKACELFSSLLKSSAILHLEEFKNVFYPLGNRKLLWGRRKCVLKSFQFHMGKSFRVKTR